MLGYKMSLFKILQPTFTGQLYIGEKKIVKDPIK